MATKHTTEILNAAIDGFEEQKKRLNAQIAELRQLLNPVSTNGATLEPTPAKRTMSAAARRRIAAAQRKRWASFKKGSGVKAGPTPVRKKRRLSAVGRRAIIEATKRRWAAARAASKR